MMLLLCHDACQASVTYLSMQEDFSEVCGPQCWRFEGLQWKVYDMLCIIPAFASIVLLFYCVLTPAHAQQPCKHLSCCIDHTSPTVGCCRLNQVLLRATSRLCPVQDGDPYGAGSSDTVGSDSKGEHLWNVQRTSDAVLTPCCTDVPFPNVALCVRARSAQHSSYRDHAYTE